MNLNSLILHRVAILHPYKLSIHICIYYLYIPERETVDTCNALQSSKISLSFWMTTALITGLQKGGNRRQKHLKHTMDDAIVNSTNALFAEASLEHLSKNI